MQKKIKLVVGLFVLLEGCALVELHVETQQTARTLSEAKRNPVVSESDIDKLDSIRIQENPSSESLEVPIGTQEINTKNQVSVDIDDDNPTGAEK